MSVKMSDKILAANAPLGQRLSNRRCPATKRTLRVHAGRNFIEFVGTRETADLEVCATLNRYNAGACDRHGRALPVMGRDACSTSRRHAVRMPRAHDRFHLEAGLHEVTTCGGIR